MRPSPQRVRGEVDRVVGDLVAYMRKRGFEAGERVGSERDFANRFGVGRRVVREALSVLESMRVVKRRPHSGIYLRPVASEGSIDAMVLFSDLGIPASHREVTEPMATTRCSSASRTASPPRRPTMRLKPK